MAFYPKVKAKIMAFYPKVKAKSLKLVAAPQSGVAAPQSGHKK